MISGDDKNNLIANGVPVPLCLINKQGKVIGFSHKIGDVFLYDEIMGSDIFTLTGVKVSDIFESAKTGSFSVLKRNNKIFQMVTEIQEDESKLAIYFMDITSLQEITDKFNSQRPCMAKIQLDNYDELTNNNRTQQPRSDLSTETDKRIRKWAEAIDGSIIRAKENFYIVLFEYKYLDKIINGKFEILDEIRALETGTDFPASLSIGLGVGGDTIPHTEEFANAALDLALGRGGDQAVVNIKGKISYFGGKLQTVEKRNKGKSRIVGHAMRQLIQQAKKVFIMGHCAPDMDCFGASLGVARLCMMSEKEPYIVIDEPYDSISEVMDLAKESDIYKFITSAKALTLADEDSLIIVVDTHRTSLVQCPELLKKSEKIIVIDHHRKVEEYIENPVLAYMESYASSTSELVTEIIGYLSSKRTLDKLEAEVLLAGITVDTNGFSVKTGVRTFEAAAWLRRQGADPTAVKRFFQEDFENIRKRAEAVYNAKINENGVAFSKVEGAGYDSQVLCAQVADSLLGLKGVTASFALSTDPQGRTVVSARSLGDINVQLIMEKLGGGGHLTTAAAQVDDTIDNTIDKISKELEVTK